MSTAVAERRLTDPYPPEVAQAIVERLAGGEFLKDICAEPGMPDRRTFWRWMDADHDLATQCAHARTRAAVVDEEKVAKIAAGVLDGTYEPDAARVAINAHTWLAKVRAPRVYGDKLEIEARVQVVPVLNVTVPGRVIDVTPGGGDGR